MKVTCRRYSANYPSTGMWRESIQANPPTRFCLSGIARGYAFHCLCHQHSSVLSYSTRYLECFPPFVFQKCAEAARHAGYGIFALRYSGKCLVEPKGNHHYYRSMGPSRNCGTSGDGGKDFIDVYTGNKGDTSFFCF